MLARKRPGESNAVCPAAGRVKRREVGVVFLVQELANTQGAPSERSHMHGSPKWRRGIPEKNLRMKAQKNSIHNAATQFIENQFVTQDDDCINVL